MFHRNIVVSTQKCAVSQKLQLFSGDQLLQVENAKTQIKMQKQTKKGTEPQRSDQYFSFQTNVLLGMRTS